MFVELPKSDSSEAPVLCIKPLAEILKDWKAEVTKKSKEAAGRDCWMFQAGFVKLDEVDKSLLDACQMTPMSPANAQRTLELPEDGEVEWKGWHAFRRGCATLLHTLGVSDIEIQKILRHSNVAVTQASYIKSPDEVMGAAMSKMESAVKKARRKGPQSTSKRKVVTLKRAAAAAD